MKYSCSECEAFFFTETELSTHMDTKHRKKKIRGVIIENQVVVATDRDAFEGTGFAK